jgi:hypothetical protein
MRYLYLFLPLFCLYSSSLFIFLFLFLLSLAPSLSLSLSHLSSLVSYLILDEYLRFLDCSTGAKIPSPSILDVGVDEALKAAGFDKIAYERRGGRYQWRREDR